MFQQAHWSDLFFNFDDAASAYDRGNDPDVVLRFASESFLRQHPDCPYPAEWLISDFKKRV